MKSFHQIASGIDVSKILKELEEHPELWGKRTYRKDIYQGPHGVMTDIWARYNAYENLGPVFNDEHDSVWYPEIELIPSVKKISLDVMRMVDGTRLGGVLLTKLPPGGRIEPHIDGGWHAGYYSKYYVALQNKKGSLFCWEDGCIEAETGEVYQFRNDVLHWVENNSDIDRISMIVCVRHT